MFRSIGLPQLPGNEQAQVEDGPNLILEDTINV